MHKTPTEKTPGLVLHLSGEQVLTVTRLLESQDNLGTMTRMESSWYYIRTTEGMLPELLTHMSTLSLSPFEKVTPPPFPVQQTEKIKVYNDIRFLLHQEKKQ